jgi:hypothetical protein
MLFPQSERQSGFLLGAIRCGRRICRAMIAVGARMTNFMESS